MRLAIHFARFGPYHLARIGAAEIELRRHGWEVVGLETASGDATYAWREEPSANNWERITVFPGEAAERIPSARLRAETCDALDRLRPDAVAIAGWGSTDARACLDWCRKNGAKAIVMSETREADGVRVWWKEWLKGRIIQRFDAALVGGRSHRDYLVKLGMPAQRVRFGYNVVDNGYFKAESRKWKAESGNEELRTRNQERISPYFLASNRFIERKNLARLIEAYALYAHSKFRIQNSKLPPWALCLLGDGELKGELVARCRDRGLQVSESAPWENRHEAKGMEQAAGEAYAPYPHAPSRKPHASPTVFFPGFRQIDELPRFYAHAGCFVHPALEEPWGLVINEAMACGLPILSGNNVGAAEELIDDGMNGWKFDVENVDEMAALLLRISAFDFPLSALGDASRRLLEERCPTEAFGKGLAALLRSGAREGAQT